jgi:hypothetical protein
MFYHYRQNNSGGGFNPPAINIIIEADNAEQANRLAIYDGLYFNGCDNGMDCPCCGDRWSEAWSDEKGTESPTIYGESVEEFLKSDYANWGEDGIPEVIIYYKNGTVQTYRDANDLNCIDGQATEDANLELTQ